MPIPEPTSIHLVEDARNRFSQAFETEKNIDAKVPSYDAERNALMELGDVLKSRYVTELFPSGSHLLNAAEGKISAAIAIKDIEFARQTKHLKAELDAILDSLLCCMRNEEVFKSSGAQRLEPSTENVEKELRARIAEKYITSWWVRWPLALIGLSLVVFMGAASWALYGSISFKETTISLKNEINKDYDAARKQLENIKEDALKVAQEQLRNELKEKMDAIEGDIEVLHRTGTGKIDKAISDTVLSITRARTESEAAAAAAESASNMASAKLGEIGGFLETAASESNRVADIRVRVHETSILVEGYRDAALQAKNDSESYRDLANQAKADSESYRDLAYQAKVDAENHQAFSLEAKETATRHADDAQMAKSGAQAHRDEALAAKNQAEADKAAVSKARLDAEAMLKNTQTSRDNAETAKNQAEIHRVDARIAKALTEAHRDAAAEVLNDASLMFSNSQSTNNDVQALKGDAADAARKAAESLARTIEAEQQALQAKTRAETMARVVSEWLQGNASSVEEVPGSAIEPDDTAITQ